MVALHGGWQHPTIAWKKEKQGKARLLAAKLRLNKAKNRSWMTMKESKLVVSCEQRGKVYRCWPKMGGAVVS